MKRNPLLDTISQKVIDESAVAISEIVEDRNITRKAAADLRDTNLKTGAWEEVWKHSNGKFVKAYRLA
jgi:hypothetical protein